LAHASYLIGDAETGIAAVVDPQRDVDGYIEDAAKLGLTIKHVFLTHFHADFIAGHLELRDRVGAQIHLGAQADADYDFVPMADGSTVEMGSVRIQVLEKPGHTPEGICVLVYDLAADADKPHAVLTGDTLFIGDVGRPDLMASIGVSAMDLAGMILAPDKAAAPRRRDAAIPWPRCRFALRQEPQQRHRFHHRCTEAVQLRVAAHEQAEAHFGGH